MQRSCWSTASSALSALPFINRVSASREQPSFRIAAGIDLIIIIMMMVILVQHNIYRRRCSINNKRFLVFASNCGLEYDAKRSRTTA
jgi:hypothetical protein